MAGESNNGQSREQKRKSGQQLGKDNVETVRAYVEGLKQRGQRLPWRKGRPNWSKIALACGFQRGIFYNNNDARTVIEQAAKNSNLEPESSPHDASNQPSENGRAAYTQKKLEGKERDVQRLEEQLAVKTAEVEELRRIKKELEEKLRQFSAFEEVMTTSGRRYIP